MRRCVVVAPLVVLASGCHLGPFTPATSVASYGQEAWDAPTAILVPSKADAIARWQLPPQNPWSAYQKLTLLAALDEVPRAAILPDVASLDVVADAQRAARNVAAAGLPADTMWVVDLRGAASVVFGAALSRRAAAPPSLVLTFNNWPAEDELIPAEETLAALVQTKPQLPDPQITSAPVFLLDAWRLAYRFEAPDDDIVDNRYILSATDLPNAETLRERGIKRVVYVVEDLDDTDSEEDDLHASFLEYQEAGVPLFMVDVETLAEPIPSEKGWDGLLTPRRFVATRRPTLIENPAFYARARGGFGGVHIYGGPSPFWSGRWGGGPVHFGGGG